DGVFILADLLGGTPSNRAAYLLNDKVRMLSGLSLVMLLTLLSLREDSTDFEEVSKGLLEETHAGIVDVNELLKKREAAVQ
ncbi:MAG: hypothetical protein RSD39_02015, partial [Oscillospiraceae bacterium]